MLTFLFGHEAGHVGLVVPHPNFYHYFEGLTIYDSAFCLVGLENSLFFFSFSMSMYRFLTIDCIGYLGKIVHSFIAATPINALAEIDVLGHVASWYAI